jgi:c-di-GMP-binding flagellar brake protein YcgR
MLERRNSVRLPLPLKVRELNGDYMYTWNTADLSEEGVFLVNKVCFSAQDHFSKLSLILPNGKVIQNITARIVREVRGDKGSAGCALEFVQLSEADRIELKRFVVERAAS